ncbi:endonuclease domain-containing protein [Chryseobacterium suipulveris]|uniref:endonuclease domain-containing protein n=1 Tax=Chryseobacterium suipulveris TaxID=2929800 RepID=UPI0037BF7187
MADFYCHQLKLVIEVDGDYHSSQEQIEKDKERTEILNSNGLEVLRFTNKEIFENIDFVLKNIELKAEEISLKTKNPNYPDPKGS